MTREEAKNLSTAWVVDSVSAHYAREKVKDSIDAIYDDFKSRTCENCKHNDGMDIIDNARDRNIIRTDPYCSYMEHMFDCGYIDKDFGCNKFESKTDDV